jgi:hypothetical protein
MDSGTDLAILGLGWTITKPYNETCLVEGEPLCIVDAVTTVVDPLVPSQSLGLIKICRALHQPDAQESLIPPAQLEWFGMDVCTKAKVHGGRQRISCDQRNVDLYFDGKLTWFLHQSPTKGELGETPLQLTDCKRYSPEQFVKELVQNEPTLTPAPTNGTETANPPNDEAYVHEYSIHDDLVPTQTSRHLFIWNPE